MDVLSQKKLIPPINIACINRLSVLSRMTLDIRAMMDLNNSLYIYRRYIRGNGRLTHSNRGSYQLNRRARSTNDDRNRDRSLIKHHPLVRLEFQRTEARSRAWKNQIGLRERR